MDRNQGFIWGGYVYPNYGYKLTYNQLLRILNPWVRVLTPFINSRGPPCRAFLGYWDAIGRNLEDSILYGRLLKIFLRKNPTPSNAAMMIHPWLCWGTFQYNSRPPIYPTPVIIYWRSFSNLWNKKWSKWKRRESFSSLALLSYAQNMFRSEQPRILSMQRITESSHRTWPRNLRLPPFSNHHSKGRPRVGS